MYSIKWQEPHDGLAVAEGLLLEMVILKDGEPFGEPIRNVFENATPEELDRRAQRKIKELEDRDAQRAKELIPEPVIYEDKQVQLDAISHLLGTEITKE